MNLSDNVFNVLGVSYAMPIHGYISTNNILKRYDISRRTLNTWRHNRGFPGPVMYGKEARYSFDAVLAWEVGNIKVPVVEDDKGSAA